MTAKMKHLITALIASAAVGQAAHAQEAPSAVAQDTKQVEQAADGMANKVAGWLDKLSDSKTAELLFRNLDHIFNVKRHLDIFKD